MTHQPKLQIILKNIDAHPFWLTWFKKNTSVEAYDIFSLFLIRKHLSTWILQVNSGIKRKYMSETAVSSKADRFLLFLSSGIDSSSPALELANENIVLNNMDPERISFLREDATEFMKGALSRNESWDIVILDPPKLAPRKKF